MMLTSKTSTSSVAPSIQPASSRNVSFAVTPAFYQPYNLTTATLNPILYPSFFSNFSFPLTSSIFSPPLSSQNSTTITQNPQPATPAIATNLSPAKPKVLANTESKSDTKTNNHLVAIVPAPKPILTALTGSKIVQDKNAKFVKIPIKDKVVPPSVTPAVSHSLPVPEKPRKRKREVPSQDSMREKRVNVLIQDIDSKNHETTSTRAHSEVRLAQKEYVTPTTSPSTSPEREDMTSSIFSISRPAVKPHRPHVNIRNVDRKRSADLHDGDYGKPARIGPSYQADIPELLQNLSQGRWSSDEEGDENVAVKQEPDALLQDAADCLLHLGDRIRVVKKPRPIGDSGERVVRSVLVSLQDMDSPEPEPLGHDAEVKTPTTSGEDPKMEAECKPMKADSEPKDLAKDPDLCIPEAVRGIRKQKQKMQYLIKWQGFKTLSWEPADSFSDDPAFQSLVESFKQRRANRSRTRSRRSRYPRARRADNADEQ